MNLNLKQGIKVKLYIHTKEELVLGGIFGGFFGRNFWEEFFVYIVSYLNMEGIIFGCQDFGFCQDFVSMEKDKNLDP